MYIFIEQNIVKATLKNSSSVTAGVLGSDLTEKFTILQFHFHWGFNDYQGSEHQIDAKKYPLEVKLK